MLDKTKLIHGDPISQLTGFRESAACVDQKHTINIKTRATRTLLRVVIMLCLICAFLFMGSNTEQACPQQRWYGTSTSCHIGVTQCKSP